MGIDNRVSCNSVQKCKSCSIVGKMPDARVKIIWNCGTEEEFGLFDDMQVQLTANKKKTPMELLTLPLPPEKRSQLEHDENFRQMRQEYQNMMKKNPNDVPTILNYAILLRNNFSEYVESREYMEKALEISPEDTI